MSMKIKIFNLNIKFKIYSLNYFIFKLKINYP